MDHLTPPIDKILVVLGLTVATFNLANVSVFIGILVGVATLFMVIPRGCLNWIEWKEKRITPEQKLEEARKLIAKAEKELEQKQGEGEYD